MIQPRQDERDIEGKKETVFLCGTDHVKDVLNDLYKELEKMARKRGVTVQELIRAVVLPEWLARQEEAPK